MESGLAGSLVGRGLDFDFVLGHDASHDLSQGNGLAVFASAGQVDVYEGERIRGQILVREGGLNTRTSAISPSRFGGSTASRGGRCQRRERLGVNYDGRLSSVTVGTRFHRGVVQGWEGVRSTFQFEPLLHRNT